MNKMKVAKFLIQKRKEHNFTQSELVKELAKKNEFLSVNSVKNWEKGIAIPELEKLAALADIYNVSIDEILNGGEVDDCFEEKYFIHKQIEDWPKTQDNKNQSLFEIRINQIILIRKTFKKLVFKYFNGDISLGDRNELEFLGNKFYLSDGGDFMDVLNVIQNDRIGENIQEKWWNLQKFVFPSGFISFGLNLIADEEFDVKVINDFFDILEDWEKDELLSETQFAQLVYRDPTKSCNALKKYEQEHGKPYNKDEIIKSTIKYLLNHGAKINDLYCGYLKKESERFNTISLYADYYKKAFEPLEIQTRINGEKVIYNVDNTPQNRLAVNYRFVLLEELKTLGYSDSEMIRLVLNNDDIPDDVYLRCAKQNNKDANQEIRFVKAEIWSKMFGIESCWYELKSEEAEIAQIKARFDVVKNNLKNKVKFTEFDCFKYVGGTTEKDRYRYVLSANFQITHKTYRKHRKDELSNELLSKIDNLCLDEIMNKYIVGGETNVRN